MLLSHLYVFKKINRFVFVNVARFPVFANDSKKSKFDPRENSKEIEILPSTEPFVFSSAVKRRKK
jgi:hypothetical protein